MTRRTGRRITPALLLLCLALPLSACGGGTDPLPGADADARYDDLATELEAALAVDGTSWKLAEDTRTVKTAEDACLFTPGTWTPESALPEPADDEAWQARADTVNTVIAGYGFETIEDVTEQGSRTVLESQDEHGATLRITAEGEVRIWDATVEADPCTAEALDIG
ncbi:hypothetical protein [Brachybacterium sp. FME24]|uniref:hypothetical protein n=1 Tax=Brachybacterium sp. FME24 TaxID=2742605 RepID=UPI00186774A3|nr:hypothetical protein [Brachybacterium sp. FME24]